MAVSRFSTSRVGAGLPKYQKLWDQTSGTTSFSPSSISGLKLWLDASDSSTITSSAGAVSQWTDKSSNAYVFSQSTAANKPTTGTVTINGKNTITYDGINDTLVSTAASSAWTSLNNGTNYTVFFVYQLYSVPSNSMGLMSTNWDGSSSVVGVNFQFADGQYNVFYPAGSSGTYNISNSTGQATAVPTIRTEVIKPQDSSTNRWNLYINGGSVIQANTRTDSYSTNAPGYTLQIGATYSSGNGYGTLSGSIAEIILYTSALSDTDRASVRNYLNSKWSVY